MPSSFWNTDRIDGEMKISRIATSNSVKLPAFTGLSSTNMYKICKTYKVQVGIGDDAGTYQAFGAPTAKRIGRRTDQILAGAFLENFAETTIKAIEAGTGGPAINGKSIMSCNTNKTLGDMNDDYYANKLISTAK